MLTTPSFPSLLTCLLFSRVTEDKNMCSRIWRSLRLGRCDRRSHSCRLKNSRTWRLIKILFLHICCRRYKVLFVFIPFCLFVCVFHNDHNSNSRCPFLHCWHAINTSSSAHLSSYLFLFFLSLSLLFVCFTISLFVSLLISFFSLCLFYCVFAYVCAAQWSQFTCFLLSISFLLWRDLALSTPFFYKKAEYGKSWWEVTIYFCAFQYFFWDDKRRLKSLATTITC